MNKFDVEFMRRLCAPFPANTYKSRTGAGGKAWTYIDPRALENRLDDVVGPHFWMTDYQDTPRGMIVKLTIHMPLYDDAGNVTGRRAVWRDACGGFKDDGGMNADGAMKAAESNGFKKVCSHFGIGRDLYGGGMPAYLADLFGGWASGTPQSQATLPAPQQPTSQAPNGQTSQPGQAGSQPPRFDPPIGKPGKNVYAWGKKMSEYFSYDLFGTMVQAAKAEGQEVYTDKWNQDFSDRAVALAMVTASRLNHYQGEFDQWLPSDPKPAAKPPMTTTPAEGNYAGAVQNNIVNNPAIPAAAPPSDALAGLKKAIVAQIQAVIHARTGKQPEMTEVAAAIGEISANCLSGNGCRGEVLQSLRNCQDQRWLNNIKTEIAKQIADLAHQRSLADAQEDDGLPC
jgi:hypothetical protein